MLSNLFFCHGPILPYDAAFVSTVCRYTTLLTICQKGSGRGLGYFPFAARTFAHRALAAAAIRAFASGLIFLRPFVAVPAAEVLFAVAPLPARSLAHRARAASAILRRPSALIFRRPPPLRPLPAEEPESTPLKIRPSSLLS